MGPELIAAAIAGPLATGVVSLFLFLHKKNYEFIKGGFENVYDRIAQVENKVDSMRIDLSTNYVRNVVLDGHIRAEENWHVMFSEEMMSMRDDMRQTRDTVNKLLEK